MQALFAKSSVLNGQERQGGAQRAISRDRRLGDNFVDSRFDECACRHRRFFCHRKLALFEFTLSREQKQLQAKPSQAKSSQVKSSQVKSSHPSNVVAPSSTRCARSACSFVIAQVEGQPAAHMSHSSRRLSDEGYLGRELRRTLRAPLVRPPALLCNRLDERLRLSFSPP